MNLQRLSLVRPLLLLPPYSEMQQIQGDLEDIFLFLRVNIMRKIYDRKHDSYIFVERRMGKSMPERW